MANRMLIGEREVAEMLSISDSTLLRLRQHGDGPPFYLIGSTRRSDPADVRAYLESCRVVPGSKAA